MQISAISVGLRKCPHLRWPSVVLTALEDIKWKSWLGLGKPQDKDI